MQEVRYDNIRVSYMMPGSVATGFSGGDEAEGRRLEDARPRKSREVVINLLHVTSAQPAEPRRAAARQSQPQESSRTSCPFSTSITTRWNITKR